MKKAVFVFLALVIIFILSATLFGEYHSSLSVIAGFAGGVGFYELTQRNIIKL